MSNEHQSLVGTSTVAPLPGPSGSAQETWIIGSILVAALYFGQHVFVPLTLAVLLTFVLAPLVRSLRRMRVGKATSVIIVVALAFGAIFGAGAAITSQIADLAQGLPVYQETLKEKVKSLKGITGGGALERASETLKDLQNELDKKESNSSTLSPSTSGTSNRTFPTIQLGDGQRPIPVEVHMPDPTPLDQLQSIVGIVVSPVATIGVVILLVVFMLIQREDLRDRAIRLFGAHDLEKSTTALDDAGYRLSRYFLTMTALNATCGVIIGCGLWVIGVPSPILWGIVAMVMRFVPFIGSYIAAAVPLLLAAAVAPGWEMFAWTLVLFVSAELIIGSVLEPLVQGQSTGLSPLAIVFSAAFWTLLWGPIGLLLAVPLTVVLVVLGKHIERLEFLNVLLGDTPPLSSAERFYQRMLADDPAEAIEQADALLKSQGLVEYFDDVVLGGLHLAQIDADRGTLLPDRLRDVQENTSQVIEALGDYPLLPPPNKKTRDDDDDEDEDEATAKENRDPADTAERGLLFETPDAWRRKSAVLCLAGRTPLDEAAADALAQLLEKHKFGAEVVAHPSSIVGVLRDRDLTGVRVICVSALDATSRSAYVRFLLRRLKRVAPNVIIVACLWALDRSDVREKAVLESVGADSVATTFDEAIAVLGKLALGDEDDKATTAAVSTAA